MPVHFLQEMLMYNSCMFANDGGNGTLHWLLDCDCVMWHERGAVWGQDLRRMCWLWQGFHGIPIDPIPITFSKSPFCKAYLLTPQSNFRKSLRHDKAWESGDLWLKGVTLQLLSCSDMTAFDITVQPQHMLWLFAQHCWNLLKRNSFEYTCH